MKARGSDGVMMARNRVRRLLRERGSASEEACFLTNYVLCGDEGLTLNELFTTDEAEVLARSCVLACIVSETQASAR
jgi:hypothetical protein